MAKPKATAATDGRLEAVVALMDEFCREHLNAEYAEICRRMAEKLARKRPSPLAKGQPKSWACGIVQTVGHLNFLGDPSQKPHMLQADIAAAFGVGESTGAAKTSEIRRLLKVTRMDAEWLLGSRMEDNPLIWMVTVNGIPVDARYVDREIQEAAFEQGAIPFIPERRK